MARFHGVFKETSTSTYSAISGGGVVTPSTTITNKSADVNVYNAQLGIGYTYKMQHIMLDFSGAYRNGVIQYRNQINGYEYSNFPVYFSLLFGVVL